MKLCDYGCGKEALFQLKNGKWCCSKHYSSCKFLIQKNPTSRGYKKVKAIIEKPEVCQYGCGQKPEFLLKNGKWCCCVEARKCPERRKQNSLMQKGKKPWNTGLTKETNNSLKIISEKLKNRVFKPETLEKMVNSHTGKSTLTENGREKKRQLLINGQSKYMNSLPRDPLKMKIKSEKDRERIFVSCIWKLRTEDTFEKHSQYMIREGSRKANIKRHNGIIDEKELDNITLYRKKVLFFTNISARKKFTKEELKQRGQKKSSNHKHIDHIFSIVEGFKAGILPQIIGSKSNLRLIPCNENYSKNGKCDISKNELFRKYEEEYRVRS